MRKCDIQFTKPLPLPYKELPEATATTIFGTQAHRHCHLGNHKAPAPPNPATAIRTHSVRACFSNGSCMSSSPVSAARTPTRWSRGPPADWLHGGAARTRTCVAPSRWLQRCSSRCSGRRGWRRGSRGQCQSPQKFLGCVKSRASTHGGGGEHFQIRP